MILYIYVSEVGWTKENISICIYMLMNFVGVKEKCSSVVILLTLFISDIKAINNIRVEVYYKKAWYVRAQFVQDRILIKC